MIHVDADVLQRLFPSASSDVLSVIGAQANEVLGRFGINANVRRLASFFAQLPVESGGLRLVRENLHYRSIPADEPTTAERLYGTGNPRLARILGNDRPGDAYKFRGGGFVQLTGRYNYTKVGQIIGLPLDEKPELSINPHYALLVAAGYWKMRGINQVADNGDFAAVVKRVNTAGLAFEKRYAAYQRFGAILDRAPRVNGDPAEEWQNAPSALRRGPGVSAAVRQLQVALSALGYHVGRIDGEFGPITEAAVLAFQKDSGLPPSGVWDDACQAALGRAGGRPLSPSRASSSVDDLRRAGSQTIVESDFAKRIALAMAAISALGASDAQFQWLGEFSRRLAVAFGDSSGTGAIVGFLKLASSALSSSSPLMWLLLAGGAGLNWRSADRIAERRVFDHRRAANISPLDKD